MSLSSVEKVIYLGESYQFDLSLTTLGDAQTDGLTATWSIADPEIATVDANGLVKAVEVGSTILTAKLSNGQYATAQVTVEKPQSMLFTNGEDVYLKPNSLSDTVRISLNLYDLNESAGLKAYSLDENVALVDTITPINSEDPYVLIRPKDEGDTKVYIENGDLKTYCTVHVGPVVTIGWDVNMQTYANSMSVYAQDEPFELVVYSQVLPDDEKNYWQREDLYEWTVEQNSPDNPAAEISDFDQSEKGKLKWTVTPKALGTTKFYVKSRGQEVSLILKVVDKEKVVVNSISILNNDTIVAFSDGTENISKTVTSKSNSLLAFIAKTNPQNAAATWPVEWSSSNPDVAYYDADVQAVRTLKDGTADITVKSGSEESGNVKSATCHVIVETQIESIAIKSDSRQKIMIGDSEQLSVSVTPSGVQPTVTWKSSDESIATVDANGIVKGLSIGKVKITAEAGGIVSSPREIEVVEPISDYDYNGAYYLYDFAGGQLSIQAQRDGDDNSSDLRATISVGSLNNGVYTVGDNMNEVTFTYKDITARITSGTISVTGDKTKEFEINLEVKLDGKTVRLSGKLESGNYAG